MASQFETRTDDPTKGLSEAASQNKSNPNDLIKGGGEW